MKIENMGVVTLWDVECIDLPRAPEHRRVLSSLFQGPRLEWQGQ